MNNETITKAVYTFMESEGLNLSILSRALGVKSHSLSTSLSKDEFSFHTILQLGYMIPEVRNIAMDEVLDRLGSASEWYEESARQTQLRERRKNLKKAVKRIVAAKPIYASAW